MSEEELVEKIDLWDLFTKDELESVTNIFSEAFSREHGSVPEIFAIETNIIIESGERRYD